MSVLSLLSKGVDALSQQKIFKTSKVGDPY